MRTRLVVAAIALVVCAQATSVGARRTLTKQSFTASALEPGAVYEFSPHVAWTDVEEYLSLYAKWFLQVDMTPRSGRRLLTVLSRDIGDDRNLVFLYWYESPYKEQYYCNYAREFFTFHLGNAATRTELRTLYDDASRLLGVPPKDDKAVIEELGHCRGNEVPPAVGEAMRMVDERFRRLVVSEEDSWSFGVNPCRVQKVRAAEESRSTVTASQLGECQKSLLEMTVENLGRQYK
jgi:hypothetical protein